MRKFYLLFIAVLFFSTSQNIFAEANYVYHEASTNNPGGCSGDNFLSVLVPNSTQSEKLAWKVEFQFYTDHTVVYYTTDGTTPAGAFGVGSGTTHVVTGNYICTFGTPLVDVATATIPAQAAGKTVKYIISAWHSGGGDEIFANGPGSPCGGGCGTVTNSSSKATVFSYTVTAANNVEVSASGGTIVGSYPTVKDAFDAINASTHTGLIFISIYGNTTEGATAVLNASGIGSASYTNINIAPAGGAARTVTGNLAAPIIDLNGANNISIDGLNTGSNSLTISNTSTAATAGTSTIRFINEASNNTITNCTILGATTATTATAAGTILISTSTGASGNDNIIISNNSIGDAGATPSMAIYSAGQSPTITNDNITVTNNNIYNFFLNAGSNGINVVSNSSAWNISQNKFYQTATRTFGASAGNQKCIAIAASTFGGFTLNNNTFGYASNTATGTMTYATGGAGRFTAIELNCAASPVSNIQGNTITAINFGTTSGSTTSGSMSFNGIAVLGGGVNVGTTSGNTIGALTGTGAIVLSSATGAITQGFNAIYCTSATGCTIQNNIIGSISASGVATTANSFYGIVLAGTGSHTVTNNTIGGTTANSISMGIIGTTTANTSMFAINSTSTGTTLNYNSNTIQNFNSNGSGTGSLMYLIISSAAAGTLNINNNTFSSNTSFGGGAASATIYYASIINAGANTTALNINNNTVNSATLGIASFGGSAGFIYNLGAGAGSSVTITNNSLTGFSFTGAIGGASASSFRGIYQSGACLNETISNNVLNNMSLKTSGSIYLIYNNYTAPVNGTKTVQRNVLSGITRTVLATTTSFFGYYDNASSTGSVSLEVSGNKIENVITNTNGTGYFAGFQSTDYSGTTIPKLIMVRDTVINVSCNQGYGVWGAGFSGSVNTPDRLDSNYISGITETGFFAGILASQPLTNVTVSNNIVKNMAGTGAAGDVGIYGDNGTGTLNIFKNNISGISNPGTAPYVVGMYTFKGTSNVYNNFISELTAPNANSNLAISGLDLNSTITNAYYNTISLGKSASLTSTGTNFGVTGLLFYNNSNAIKNNIINVNATAKGTGTIVALRDSVVGVAGTPPTISRLDANNNIYYVTPGSSNFLYAEGYANTPGLIRNGYAASGITPDVVNNLVKDSVFNTTCSSYKIFISTGAPGREDSTFTEDNLTTLTPTTFTPSGASYAESGGITISGIPNDYADVARTIPDIGALQFSGSIPNIHFITITTDPVDDTDCAGNSAKFWVAATGTSLTYKWQVSTDNGVNWNNATGGVYSTETTDTLHISDNSGLNGYKFRVLVSTTTPCIDSLYSDTATLTVNPRPTGVISGGASVCADAHPPVTITFTGTAPWSVTYFDGTNPTTVNNIHTNPYIFNTTQSTNTTYTLTALSDSNCTALPGDLSGNATITVSPIPDTTNRSFSSPAICAGNADSVKITSSSLVNGNYRVHFNIGTPNASFNNDTTLTMAGGTGTFYTPVLANSGFTTITVTDIRFAGTNCTTQFAARDSLVIFVKANSTPPTGINATKISICKGDSTTLSVVGGTLGARGNVVLTIGAQWKWYSGGCGTGGVIGTGPTIKVAPNTNITYFVRAEGTCNTTTCASLLITVVDTPTITINPSSAIICSGGSVGLVASGASTYAWAPATGLDKTTGDSVIANPTGNKTYTVTGTSNGCSSKDSVTVTVNPAGNSLAGTTGGSQVCTNSVIAPSGTVYDESTNCNLIATIVPSGANPVSGIVNTCVKIDATVQTVNFQSYVQRHYDIEPASNPNTATATLTLYFTQTEFDNYNAAKSILFPALPTGPSDNIGISNLRITQFHGTGTAPGNYTGSEQLIDPADNQIVWNNTASRWEVTIDVVGFSGFYVTTGPVLPLPITIAYLRGQKVGSSNLLNWKVDCGTSSSAKFNIERSTDGRNFVSIGEITSTRYRCNQPFDFNDASPVKGSVNYYRLRMTDVDGHSVYSSVVAIINKESGFEIVGLLPNLIRTGVAVLNVTSARSTNLEIVVTDIAGRVVMRRSEGVIEGSNSYNMNFSSLANGTYQLTAHTTEGVSKTVKFVKE